MSAELVSGWAATAAVALASPSSARKFEQGPAAGKLRAAGDQSLIPVVGLVNRMRIGRILRCNQQQRQKQQSSRIGAGRQPRWVAQQTKKGAVSVSESDFEAEVLKSSVPVLVDFWATWCGPCMGITLDWATQQYEGKVKCVKIETDANQALVDKYDVYGLPTLILFVNGEVVPNTHREGALTKEKLQQYLEANLPTLAATA